MPWAWGPPSVPGSRPLPSTDYVLTPRHKEADPLQRQMGEGQSLHLPGQGSAQPSSHGTCLPECLMASRLPLKTLLHRVPGAHLRAPASSEMPTVNRAKVAVAPLTPESWGALPWVNPTPYTPQPGTRRPLCSSTTM